jgi:hypothetical protein
MIRYGKIVVETTQAQKQALTSVLRENGATLTEWFADNLAEATADFSVETISSPPELRDLDALADSGEVFSQLKKVGWAFSDDDTTYLSHDIHPYGH